MKLPKPREHRVLIKAVEDKNESKIIMPDGVQKDKKMITYYVEDVPEDVKDLSIGDEVILWPHAQGVVWNDCGEYSLISETDIWGVIKND